MLVHVKHRYIAQDAEELTIQPGDVLNLIEEYDDGWCLLQKNGESYSGLAPLNHVNIIMDGDDVADTAMRNLIDQDVDGIYDGSASDVSETGKSNLIFCI